MKKLLIILLLSVYATSLVGATLHFHYCMGELVEVSFKATEDKVCSKCGMHKVDKSGCCEDVKKEIKLKTEHQKNATQDITFKYVTAPAILTPAFSYNIPLIYRYQDNYPDYRPPPPKELRQKRCILYCNYRI